MDNTTRVAVWVRADRSPEILDEGEIAIDGLARSRVEFAGDRVDEPRSSRLTRFTAPRRGTAAPGIDPARLHMPVPP